MTATGLGLGLLGLGVALVIGAGVPQKGFSSLLEHSRRENEKQERPNIDESFANITLRFYMAGGAIAALGATIYLVGTVLGE